VRHRNANQERRDGDDETGNWSSDTDVEEHVLLWDRFADANEGAERPGNRNRHRQEKRERRIDVIIAAGDVVPELVAAKNGKNRRAVIKAAKDEREKRNRRRSRGEISEEAFVLAHADKGRRQDS